MQQLPHLLSGPLRELAPPLVLALLERHSQAPALQATLQCWEWQDVIDCAHGHRSLDHALPSLRRWLEVRRADWQTLPHLDQCLLVGRLWQYQSWSSLAPLCQRPGQKALQQA